MAVIRNEKNLDSGLGLKFKKYIKISAINLFLEIRIRRIMLILENL